MQGNDNLQQSISLSNQVKTPFLQKSPNNTQILKFPCDYFSLYIICW